MTEYSPTIDRSMLVTKTGEICDSPEAQAAWEQECREVAEFYAKWYGWPTPPSKRSEVT